MSHQFRRRSIWSGEYAGAGLLLVAVLLCAGCSQEGTVVGQQMSTIFPSDLTNPPNAKPTEVSPKGEFSQLKVSDSVKQVADFYQDKSKNNGWDVSRTIPRGPSATIVILTKGDRTASLTITSGKASGGAAESVIEVAVR